MTYVDGFLVPVPRANMDRYREMAELAAQVWMDHGALDYMEAWEDDVKPGKVNDFRTAVIAEEDEVVVFSWVVWPSKEARDTGSEKVMADPRLKDHGDKMPFSGARMIYGGFAPFVERKA
jgi:uncharacterized protein YbaA (DUF1428 family)